MFGLLEVFGLDLGEFLLSGLVVGCLVLVELAEVEGFVFESLFHLLDLLLFIILLLQLKLLINNLMQLHPPHNLLQPYLLLHQPPNPPQRLLHINSLRNLLPLLHTSFPNNLFLKLLSLPSLLLNSLLMFKSLLL